MNEYTFSPSANRDLAEIADWYEGNAPAIGEWLFAALRRQFQMLARFPGMGRERSDLSPNLRSFVVSPYLIFFRQTTSGVEIARVLHGRRNITGEMFE